MQRPSFATYVENGNGTKEQWDLHNLPAVVVSFGSVVVVFGAAVCICPYQLQRCRLLHRPPTTPTRHAATHSPQHLNSQPLRTYIHAYIHGNISSPKVVQWCVLDSCNFDAVFIHKFAVCQGRVLRANELLVPSARTHGPINCPRLQTHNTHAKTKSTETTATEQTRCSPEACFPQSSTP